MRFNRSILLGALFALAIPCSVQAEDSEEIQRIIAMGRDDNRVQQHLDYLTNRIGPRLTSSDGLQRACEWAVDYFKSIGIENARLEKWGEFPVGFNRGHWEGRMLEPEPMPLTFGTNSWTAGTTGRENGPAVLAPKTMEELEAMRDKLKGAWVFVPRQSFGRSRGGRGRAGGRGGRGQAQQPEQTEEQAEARRKALAQAEEQRKVRTELANVGAAGIVQPTSGELILTSGRSGISYDELPTTPQISLLRNQWDSIVERLNKDERVILEFDIRNHFVKGPIPLYNVIADIPGTEFPDEYVVVGGHIDSWDGATGATDNASGCATAIEAARILMRAGVKPRRTIRFMLWSGEEQGLLGSRAYVEQNPEVVKNVSACLVHDGGTNYISGIRVTDEMVKDMETIFAPAKELDPRTPFEVEEVSELRGGGSDHSSFLRAGIPGFFWSQAGRAVYRQTHHTQYDTYDSVVPEYQEHSSIVISIGARGIANLDKLLPRNKIAGR